MPLNAFRIHLICTLLIHFNLSAQDKIYLNSGVIACNIIEITPAIVNYLPLRSSKSVSVYVNKIAILFNEKGLFLIPSKTDFSLQKNQAYIKKFLQDESLNLSSDYIYKIDNSVVNEEITKEDKNFVYLKKNEIKIDKKSIAVIIYKDGHHILFTPVSKVADILWARYENNFQSNNIVNTPVKKEIPLIANNNTKSINSEKNIPASRNAKTEVQEKIITTERPPAVSASKIINEASLEKAAVPSSYIDLPPLREQEFKDKARKKAIEFSNYLLIICNKKNETEDIDKAINQAVLLFVDEDATVAVSSLTKNTEYRKIKNYLKHLKLANYERVELTWTKVQYVTDIKKRPDGNYSGTITFEQEFKGYKDGVVVYSDVTVKKALVILKTYEKNVEGKAINLWDILLGDIGVESTSAL